MPTVVVWSFGGGEVGAKVESIGGGLVFGKELVGNNKITTRECVISECSVPRANGCWGIAGTCGRILAKKFLVGSTFKYGAVLENDTRSNDEWINVEILRVAGGSKKWCHVGDAKNDAGILVGIVTFEDVGWKGLVVEDVRWGCDIE